MQLYGGRGMRWLDCKLLKEVGGLRGLKCIVGVII